jgi:hypothetical protein
MPRIAGALGELVREEIVREVLPALQTLFFETLPSGPVQETIAQFTAARQFAGHPVAFCRWERKSGD